MDIITDKAQTLLPRLDPAFERGAFILHNNSPYLTDNFRRFIQVQGADGDFIACTSSVLDIVAGESLRYARDKGHRCFCMYLNVHPEAMPRDMFGAAVVHEAAHFITDRHSSRDEPDEQKAIRDWWASPSAWSNEHGRESARAAMHLSYRAMTAGAPVAVDELLASAGLDDSFIAGVRNELVSRANEPIEAIIGSRGAVQTSTATTAKRRRSVRFDILGGEPVEHLADGGIRTFPDNRGGKGATYKSVRDYYNARDFADVA